MRTTWRGRGNIMQEVKKPVRLKPECISCLLKSRLDFAPEDTPVEKKIEYMLVLWAVFCIVVPIISRYVPSFKLSEHVDLVLCEGYIGYFLLGYYLKKYNLDVNSIYERIKKELNSLF